eukprot:365571-Chlamydomonas_euryale.AAC.8
MLRPKVEREVVNLGGDERNVGSRAHWLHGPRQASCRPGVRDAALAAASTGKNWHHSRCAINRRSGLRGGGAQAAVAQGPYGAQHVAPHDSNRALSGSGARGPARTRARTRTKPKQLPAWRGGRIQRFAAGSGIVRSAPNLAAPMCGRRALGRQLRQS